MQKLQQEATAAGVVWLTVISSAPGKQGYLSGAEANALKANRAARGRPPCCSIPKGTIGRAYEAKTTPHMFVIDKAGVLRYMGAIDDKPVAAAREPDRRAQLRARGAHGCGLRQARAGGIDRALRLQREVLELQAALRAALSGCAAPGG